MTSARIRALLALLIVASIAVRMLGIDFGLPWSTEPDTFIVAHVRALRAGEPHALDRHLSSLQYPSLLAELSAPWSSATGTPTGAEGTLGEHLRSASRPWLDVRILGALLSVLVVPATFVIARRFVSPWWALFAAALPAFSLLDVCFSQQARPHGASTALSAVALACALWLRRAPSWRSIGATALAAALALGVLHNGFAVLLPIAAAQLLRDDRRHLDARVLVIVAACAASFRYFYWFFFDAAARAAVAQEEGSHFVLSDLPFDGSGFARLADALWSYEPLLAVLLAVAALAWLVGLRVRSTDPAARRDAWVVLAYALPYTLLAGAFDHTYERFLLPLLPSLAVFAAWGLATSLAQRPRAVAAPLALLLLALCAFTSTKLAWLRARPDTFEQVAAWVRDQPPAERASVFVMPPDDFPWLRARASLLGPRGKATQYSPWSEYQARMAVERDAPDAVDMQWLGPRPKFGEVEDEGEALAYLRSWGAGVFISEVLDRRLNPQRVLVSRTLRQQAVLLARFSPDGNPRFSEHPLWAQDAAVDDWPNVFLRVLRARAVGPVIEIYRLD